MYVPLRFQRREIESLFLTYRQNAPNYQRIKEIVLGDGDEPDMGKLIRSRSLFVIVLGIVAVVGSAFSFVSDNYDTIVALWTIWASGAALTGGLTYLQYRSSYRVWQDNRRFFDEFEAKAKGCKELEAFNQAYFKA